MEGLKRDQPGRSSVAERIDTLGEGLTLALCLLETRVAHIIECEVVVRIHDQYSKRLAGRPLASVAIGTEGNELHTRERVSNRNNRHSKLQAAQGRDSTRQGQSAGSKRGETFHRKTPNQQQQNSFSHTKKETFKEFFLKLAGTYRRQDGSCHRKKPRVVLSQKQFFKETSPTHTLRSNT